MRMIQWHGERGERDENEREREREREENTNLDLLVREKQPQVVDNQPHILYLRINVGRTCSGYITTRTNLVIKNSAGR